MWKILEAYGIPSKILRNLQILRERSERCVQVSAEHTSWFRMDTGAIQGDSLSYILFNVVLKFVLSKLSYIDGSNDWRGNKRLKDFDYAEHMCLLANNMNSNKSMTELVVEEIVIRNWDWLHISIQIFFSCVFFLFYVYVLNNIGSMHFDLCTNTFLIYEK